MTLKQLEYFLAIAETGNISSAAIRINISQPPLSLQLQNLENELGVKLFTREKKRLLITRHGLLLKDYAKRILALTNEAVISLHSSDNLPKIVFRIATISSVCNRILPGKIHLFNTSYPHVEFEIFETDTLSVIEKLSSHAVDFGFVREPFNNTLYHAVSIKDPALDSSSVDYFCTLGYEKYFDDPSASTIPLVSLKDKPIIIHRRHHDLFVSACKKSGFTPHIVCQNDNIWSSISMAASDIGVTLTPYTSALLNTNQDLIIKKVDSPGLITRTYLTWNRDVIFSPEMQAFINMFQ